MPFTVTCNTSKKVSLAQQGVEKSFFPWVRGKKGVNGISVYPGEVFISTFFALILCMWHAYKLERPGLFFSFLFPDPCEIYTVPYVCRIMLCYVVLSSLGRISI